jgi:hypothetical protein
MAAFSKSWRREWWPNIQQDSNSNRRATGFPSSSWPRLRAHHDKRAGGRPSWTGDSPFVHDDNATSAWTTIGDDKHLILVTLASAGCGRAVETCNSYRLFGIATRARRARRTLRALWSSRSRWTWIALFASRPRRTGVSLWPGRTFPAACYANGNRDSNGNITYSHPFAYQAGLSA